MKSFSLENMEFNNGHKLITENLNRNDQIEHCLNKKAEFTIVDKIGRGSFGVVYHVKHNWSIKNEYLRK